MGVRTASTIHASRIGRCRSRAMSRLWHGPAREPRHHPARPASMPTPNRLSAPVLVVLAAFVAACSGSAAAPSTAGSSAAVDPAGATPAPEADHIDHPTGAADIVLRVGEEGG